MTRNKRTVEDLIDEMDGPAPTTGEPPKRKPQGGWIPAAALLALGIGIGWFASGLRQPNQGAAATKPGMETPEDLISAGWQESDQGVFTRRCQDNCRKAVLYGGGVADVMEVNCLDRPCGEIRAKFDVLDGRGQSSASPADSASPLASAAPAITTTPAEPVPSGSEPAPGSPEALALLASLGIAPPAAAGTPLGPDDQRFSPIAIGHLTHRLVEVKLLLDQLGAEQKELHDTLRLAHLRGDLRHLQPPGGEGGYQLPGGVQLHRRAGRRQWQYGPEVQELEAQLKAQQVYEQTNGQAVWSLGAAFWELRFPKG
jgi:hypothetical protein